MSLLEKFNVCTAGHWITAGLNVQYKVVDRILYFQCSHGEEDWKHNFQFAVDVYKDGYIPFRAHRGFVKMWQSIRHEIEHLDFDTIVGYSQGSALALFAHENFLHRKGYEPMTYTFGMPRVVWMPKKILETRFTKLVRVCNPNDIVTHVPPAIIGYRHVGVKLLLEGKATKSKDVKLLKWLSGHTPEEYRQRLEKQ